MISNEDVHGQSVSEVLQIVFFLALVTGHVFVQRPDTKHPTTFNDYTTHPVTFNDNAKHPTTFKQLRATFNKARHSQYKRNNSKQHSTRQNIHNTSTPHSYHHSTDPTPCNITDHHHNTAEHGFLTRAFTSLPVLILYSTTVADVMTSTTPHFMPTLLHAQSLSPWRITRLSESFNRSMMSLLAHLVSIMMSQNSEQLFIVPLRKKTVLSHCYVDNGNCHWILVQLSFGHVA